MTQTLLSTRIAFIKASWHSDIVDNAYHGFRNGFPDPGPIISPFTVPGAFEIPLLAQKLAQSGEFDAIVGAAFVVNGGIYHHEFVSASVVDALMQVQLKTNVPVFSVVLTPHNYQDTADLNSFFRAHFITKGEEAANAVLDTLNVHRALSA